MNGSTKLTDVVTESIAISDATCVDCSGPVTFFAVVDKVWDGVGLSVRDWICIECFARRLDPGNPPGTLGKMNALIVRRRLRFRLGQFNGYFAQMRLPLNRSVIVVIPGEESMQILAVEECGTGSEPRICGVYSGEDELQAYPVTLYHVSLIRSDLYPPRSSK